MFKRLNIFILENINIYVYEKNIKENVLYVDIKCNWEKWFLIYIFLKDFEILYGLSYKKV